MRYLLTLCVAATFFWGCRKKDINPTPDALIKINTYYGINQTTLDTVFTFYIPNGFTPNGDGINEYWEPKSYGWDSSQYHIDILDKSGRVIFKSGKPAKWYGVDKSGQIYAEQTFCFFIEVKDKSGNSYKYKGQFVLIR